MKSPCSVLYFFLFTDSSTRQTATPTPRAPDATTNDGATLDLITLTRQRGGRRRCSLGHQSSCFRCWPVVPPDYYCVSVSLACSPRCHRAPSSSQVRYYLATVRLLPWSSHTDRRLQASPLSAMLSHRTPLATCPHHQSTMSVVSTLPLAGHIQIQPSCPCRLLTSERERERFWYI